jgi:hypothetical protein
LLQTPKTVKQVQIILDFDHSSEKQKVHTKSLFKIHRRVAEKRVNELLKLKQQKEQEQNSLQPNSHSKNYKLQEPEPPRQNSTKTENDAQSSLEKEAAAAPNIKFKEITENRKRLKKTRHFSMASEMKRLENLKLIHRTSSSERTYSELHKKSPTSTTHSKRAEKHKHNTSPYSKEKKKKKILLKKEDNTELKANSSSEEEDLERKQDYHNPELKADFLHHQFYQKYIQNRNQNYQASRCNVSNTPKCHSRYTQSYNRNLSYAKKNNSPAKRSSNKKRKGRNKIIHLQSAASLKKVFITLSICLFCFFIFSFFFVCGFNFNFRMLMLSILEEIIFQFLILF